MNHASILVMDDNSKTIESLSLAFLQYHFVSAMTVEDGIRLLDRPHTFDLILLDEKMSGMNDGAGILKRLRSLDPKLKTLIITSPALREQASHALYGYADEFCDKPINVDELGGKIGRLLKERETEDRPVEGDASTQKVMRLLQRNFEKSMTLRDAAEHVLLSPKYLSRKFKKETRKSFTEVRLGLRMDKAKEMLKNSSLSVNEISGSLGYENAESFMKMFKKATGQTPSQYRTASK